MVEKLLRPSISKRPSFLAFAAASLMLLISVYSSAQTDQGAITGIVQDSSGAVIANAQVTATNIILVWLSRPSPTTAASLFFPR